MDFLDNMINSIGAMFFKHTPTMVKVNKNMYDLLMELTQTKDIDYDAPYIYGLNALTLVIDDTLDDYDFKIE